MPVASSSKTSLTLQCVASSIGRVLTSVPNNNTTPLKKVKTDVESESGDNSPPITFSANAVHDEDMWILSGQCVCVIHSRILLTATHACYQGATRLKVRVVYSPADGTKCQVFPARVLRYSGKMDVSVLLLDTVSSPFKPVAVAPTSSPKLKALQSVVLACFPLEVDLLLNSDTIDDWEPSLRLSYVPQLMGGAITSTMYKTTCHKGVTRTFTLSLATYQSFASCTGGAVFAQTLNDEGQPELLGIHTNAAVPASNRIGIYPEQAEEFEENYNAEELKKIAKAEPPSEATTSTPKADSSASEIPNSRKRKADDSQEDSLVPSESFITTLHDNRTPETFPMKLLTARPRDCRNQCQLSVFVGAHMALSQHYLWTPACLRKVAEQSTNIQTAINSAQKIATE